MKTIRFKLSAVALLFALAACKKNNNDSANASISTDEAATIMASSMSSNSGGFVAASADVTLNAQVTIAANPGCGGTRSYNFSRQNPQGSSVTYSYAFNYTYTVNCVNNTPDNVTSSASSTGSYSGPNLTATDAGVSTLTVGGIALNATAYTLNGTYKRAGSFAQKTGDMKSGNSSVDITVSNVTIPKANGTIASGSASFNLSGTANNGAFSFSGTITFTGSNQANLVINGTAYLVNLSTGTATKS